METQTRPRRVRGRIGRATRAVFVPQTSAQAERPHPLVTALLEAAAGGERAGKER
jgi:hypothetical protein